MEEGSVWKEGGKNGGTGRDIDRRDGVRRYGGRGEGEDKGGGEGSEGSEERGGREEGSEKGREERGEGREENSHRHLLYHRQSLSARQY